MRRSKKETILLGSNNRLLHNDIHESAGMDNGSFAAEAAEEWAGGSGSVKPASRKPHRT